MASRSEKAVIPWGKGDERGAGSYVADAQSFSAIHTSEEYANIYLLARDFRPCEEEGRRTSARHCRIEKNGRSLKVFHLLPSTIDAFPNGRECMWRRYDPEKMVKVSKGAQDQGKVSSIEHAQGGKTSDRVSTMADRCCCLDLSGRAELHGSSAE